MNKKSIFTIFYLAAAVLLIAWIFVTVNQGNDCGGGLLLLFFLSLGGAFRGNQFLKGLSYTVMIIGVVDSAMYYPQHFITIGSFKLSTLIVPLPQIIMFGIGTVLSLKDFAYVVDVPKGIIVGAAFHYLIMPLVGVTVGSLINFRNETAAGTILVGCCPSRLASNVMAYLSRANLALSVSVTTICTLLAPFLTPLLLQWLGSSFVLIDFWAMVWDITKIVIIPMVAGLSFHYLILGRFGWLDKIIALLSMGGITVILAIMAAAGRDNLLKVGALLLVATFIYNIAGFFRGYWSAGLLRFDERDCRTIALEVGAKCGISLGPCTDNGGNCQHRWAPPSLAPS